MITCLTCRIVPVGDERGGFFWRQEPGDVTKRNRSQPGSCGTSLKVDGKTCFPVSTSGGCPRLCAPMELWCPDGCISNLQHERKDPGTKLSSRNSGPDNGVISFERLESGYRMSLQIHLHILHTK